MPVYVILKGDKIWPVAFAFLGCVKAVSPSLLVFVPSDFNPFLWYSGSSPLIGIAREEYSRFASPVLFSPWYISRVKWLFYYSLVIRIPSSIADFPRFVMGRP